MKTCKVVKEIYKHLDKQRMTDREQCELLEKFINDSPIAKYIKVEVSLNQTSFKPRDEAHNQAYYEDANLLASILKGAEHFCYWLRRNGYNIKRSKNVER